MYLLRGRNTLKWVDKTEGISLVKWAATQNSSVWLVLHSTCATFCRGSFTRCHTKPYQSRHRFSILRSDTAAEVLTNPCVRQISVLWGQIDKPFIDPEWQKQSVTTKYLYQICFTYLFEWFFFLFREKKLFHNNNLNLEFPVNSNK